MELDLRGYMKIIRKRVWLLISIVVLSCITTGVVSYFFLTPIYEASTKLIVNKPNEGSAVGQLTINDVNLNIRVIDTYKEVIKTHYIMGIVAAEHPEFGLSSGELINKVRVSSVNNTQVMTLIVSDPSYEKAARIVNAISQIFMREIPKLMSVDNVSLLNEASVTAQPGPIKPNPNLNIAIGFVVSVMVAVGLIFLLEYLDDTIRTEADVHQFLGLPTLTAITKIDPEDMKNTSSRSVTSNPRLGEPKNVNATLNQ